MTDKRTITAADDFHCHLRDGHILKSVLPYTANHFARAIIMPNLKQPVTTGALARAYRAEIENAFHHKEAAENFTPLMTIYLTDESDEQDIKTSFVNGDITAAKLYPANATTNSAHGVSDITKLDKVFKTMADIGMPLLIHGEVTDASIDIFDREAVFIETILKTIRVKFPSLKIVLEHITTKQAVEYVGDGDDFIAATITPHHMVINRNALFQGGLRPHHYCLPVAKREGHRQAVHDAAISGNPKFFAGTDSAPHLIGDKEKDCGCAGIFNSFQAPALYADIFDKAGAIDKLEGFLSHHGADFYGLKRNEGKITLTKESITIPDYITISGDENAKIKPFMAGEVLNWRVEDH